MTYTYEQRMELFEKLETGAVSDAMIAYGIGQWAQGIFPIKPDMKIYGRASTAQFAVITPPRKIMNQYDVIETAQPGDVLVWSSPVTTNIMGENIMNFLVRNGMNGIVVDGYCRDMNLIGESGKPFFSKGRAIASSSKNFMCSPEFINVPVSCGGVVVNPGDYIFGDNDGIMVIPKDAVDDVLYQAQIHMEWEKTLAEGIRNGADAKKMKELYSALKIAERGTF